MFLWFLLGALYFVAMVVLGVASLRRGHWVLFGVGIIFPVLWIFGALMPPTQRVRAAGTVG